jgi:hypothetical protein
MGTAIRTMPTMRTAYRKDRPSTLQPQAPIRIRQKHRPAIYVSVWQTEDTGESFSPLKTWPPTKENHESHEIAPLGRSDYQSVGYQVPVVSPLDPIGPSPLRAFCKRPEGPKARRRTLPSCPKHRRRTAIPFSSHQRIFCPTFTNLYGVEVSRARTR